jgi:TatD DNase family protein
MQYFDFHTHNKRANNAIINLFHYETPNETGQFSAGIHPWHIEQDKIVDSKNKLTRLAGNKLVQAVGECGFDKKSAVNFVTQKDLFLFHADLSEKLHKPLIIHCTGFYNELISIKKQYNPNLPWIIHGYNKNTQILQQLVASYLYFSIGGRLINNQEKMLSFLKIIPLDRLLLESDDSGIEINLIYEKVSNLLDIDINDLTIQLNHNIENVLQNK